MPRDASGNYTLASGNPVTPLTPIESSWANSTLDDIASGLTNSLSRTGLGGMLAPLELAGGTTLLPGLNWGDVDTGMYGATGEIHVTVAGTTVMSITAAGVEFGIPVNLTEGSAGPVISKSTTADPTSDASFTLQNSAGTEKGKFYWTGTVTVLEPASATDALNIGGVATFTSTSGLKLPTGTTAERPASPADGDTRYNSTLDQPEMYSSTLGWMGSVPPGAMLLWGAAAAPAGWAIANGAAVSRTDNPFLFAAYGTTYGAGDGSTTFNLPDLVMRVPIGVGTRTAYTESIDPSAVNTGTDLITVASNQKKWISGTKVRVSSTGTLPAPLVAATDYWVIRSTDTGIFLSTTLQASLIASPTQINLTTQGTGVHTITEQLSSGDTVALAEVGGQSEHTQRAAEVGPHVHTFHTNTGQTNCGGGPSPVWTYSGGAVTGVNVNTVSAAANVMQPFIGLNYIIKLG